MGGRKRRRRRRKKRKQKQLRLVQQGTARDASQQRMEADLSNEQKLPVLRFSADAWGKIIFMVFFANQNDFACILLLFKRGYELASGMACSNDYD